MQCNPEKCENRLFKEFSSDNTSQSSISQSSASQISFLNPYHNSNIDTSCDPYPPVPSFAADTWGMDRMSLGVVQRTPNPYTVNNYNGDKTSESNLPRPGGVPMWSGSPTNTSQHRTQLMEKRMFSPSQTAIAPLQSYSYPVNQVSYGSPTPPTMNYSSPNGAYNYNHSAPALG